jgi:LacI family repressor for deo operon, udp, cdd, tsx, nupC, and nupG
MKHRISIKDIAEVAGVSAPTVSRALQGNGRMSESTRHHILTVAQQLGYTPSLVARGLVTQRSHCIGLVVTTFADPFHSEVAQGVEEEAQRHNFSLFLASTNTDPEREVKVVHSFQGRQVDGVIVSSSRVGNRYADLLQDSGIPLVLINTHIRPTSTSRWVKGVANANIHAVAHDDYQGGRLLMEHLIARGYRRIAYIGDERGGQATIERRRAWFQVMQEAGFQPAVAVNGPVGRLEGGVSAVEQLLSAAQHHWGEPPEAICCYNDMMAIGVLSVLTRYGFKIPEDIAVTGFDDVDVAAFTVPPLTTLHQPRREMGACAMRVLLDLINKTPGKPPQTTVMVGKLIVRGST